MSIKGLYVVWTFLAASTLANGQTKAAQSSDAQPKLTSNGVTNGLPLPPPGIITGMPAIPSQQEIQAANGPQIGPSPENQKALPKEEGFPAISLQPSSSTFSFSDHDIEKSKDVSDMILDETNKQTLGDRPSMQSTIIDAVASGSEKLGDMASSDFWNKMLTKTLPTFVKSSLVSDALNGGLLLVDSEPTGGPDIDQPSSVRTMFYGLQNLARVGVGQPSPLGDPNIAQACARLRSLYTQNQFNLNAPEQEQVQQALNYCQQQSSGSPFVAAPTINFASGISQRTAPKPQAVPRSSDCPPGSKMCR